MSATPKMVPIVAEPLIKYAGGKRAIAHEIISRMPARWLVEGNGIYHEPFFGGGAVFFALRNGGWKGAAFLSDVNEDVVAIYSVARDTPQSMITALVALRSKTDEQSYYYHRNVNPALLPKHGRAVRAVYLNKTCFNGLYRTSKAGAFNVPWGRKKNPSIIDPDKFLLASQALARTIIEKADFMVAERAKKGDVVYFDPPYVPISKTSSFTGYNGGFSLDDQKRLRDFALKLKKRGVHVILSNSACDTTRELYSAGFKIEEIEAPRRIAAKDSSRGPVKEFIIT